MSVVVRLLGRVFEVPEAAVEFLDVRARARYEDAQRGFAAGREDSSLTLERLVCGDRLSSPTQRTDRDSRQTVHSRLMLVNAQHVRRTAIWYPNHDRPAQGIPVAPSLGSAESGARTVRRGIFSGCL